MNKRFIIAAVLGGLSAYATAQVAPSDVMRPQDSQAAIEGAGDNSVNTSATAAQEEESMVRSGSLRTPTDAERATDLAPTMDIPNWQAGAGAASGAGKAAATQSMPSQRVPLNTPEAEHALEGASTP